MRLRRVGLPLRAGCSEIDELAWFCYADRARVPRVDQLLFDDLKAAGQLR